MAGNYLTRGIEISVQKEFQGGRVTDKKLLRKTKAQLADEVSALRRLVRDLQAGPPAHPSDDRGSASSERQFMDFFESSDLSFLVHQDGYFVYANNAAATMYGAATAEELVGTRWFDIVHPSYRDVLDKRRNDIVTKKSSMPSIEQRRLRLDGKEIFVESAGHPITWNGRDAVAGVSVDITARKAMEAAVRESEAQLAEAQDIARVGSWDWDTKTNTARFSRAYYTIFGLDPSAYIGGYDDFIERVHPDDREAVAAASAAARREDHPLDMKFRIVRPDGSIRHVHSRAQVSRSETGEPLRLTGTVQDITEQSLSEEARRANEALLSLVMDNVPALIAYVGADLRYRYANEQFVERFGIPLDKIIGAHMFDLTETRLLYFAHGAAGERRRKRVAAALAGKEQFFEGEGFVKDGRPRHVRGAHIPHFGPDGEVLGICIFIYDVTAEKETELALRESEDRYRQLVEQSPAAVLVECDESIIFVNARALELLGASSPDQVIGRETLDFVHPRFRDHARERRAQLLAGKIPSEHTVERVHLRLDGSEFPSDTTASSVNWQGRPAVQIIIQDVSERRNAIEALRQSEERYRRLAELSPDAIFVTGENEIFFANEAAARLLGARRPEEIIGIDPMTVFPAEELPRQHERRGPLFTDGKALALSEQRRLRLDGTVIDVEAGATAINWKGKRALLGITRDITERKRMENALRQSEAQYRSLVEQGPDAVLVVVADAVRYSNDAAARLLAGGQHGKLHGTDLGEIVHPVSRSLLSSRVLGLDRGEAVGFTKLTLTRLDGSQFLSEVGLTSVRWEDDAGIQIAIRDISDRSHLFERFERLGEAGLDDAEMLELILWRALRQPDSTVLASRLLEKFGGFANVISAERAALSSIQGMREEAIVAVKSVQDAAIRLARAEVLDRPVLKNWDRLIGYLRTSMGRANTEQLRILFLDGQGRLIQDEVMHSGTIDHSPIYPREVAKRALECAAAGIIIVHNHPGGNSAPSEDDIDSTNRVKQAVEPLDIQLHDHVIVSRAGFTSFKDMELL